MGRPFVTQTGYSPRFFQVVKARKLHSCNRAPVCGGIIAPGDEYVRLNMPPSLFSQANSQTPDHLLPVTKLCLSCAEMVFTEEHVLTDEEGNLRRD
jgi:hypothetical protein